MELCIPVIVYLVIQLINLIVSGIFSFSLASVAIQAVFTVFIAMFMQYLCSNGYVYMTWFILFIPYIIFIFYILALKEIGKQIKVEYVKEETKTESKK